MVVPYIIITFALSIRKDSNINNLKIMSQIINIAEILKDAPKGTILYSPFCGECEFCGLLLYDKIRPIQIKDSNSGILFRLTSHGKFFANQEAECLLFPSKNHCDWSTFKAPWMHKHFEPYQKVLVASDVSDTWEPDIYRLYDAKVNMHKCMLYTVRKDSQIIPYKGNEDKVGKSVK